MNTDNLAARTLLEASEQLNTQAQEIADLNFALDCWRRVAENPTETFKEFLEIASAADSECGRLRRMITFLEVVATVLLVAAVWGWIR